MYAKYYFPFYTNSKLCLVKEVFCQADFRKIGQYDKTQDFLDSRCNFKSVDVFAGSILNWSNHGHSFIRYITFMFKIKAKYRVFIFVVVFAIILTKKFIDWFDDSESLYSQRFSSSQISPNRGDQSSKSPALEFWSKLVKFYHENKIELETDGQSWVKSGSDTNIKSRNELLGQCHIQPVDFNKIQQNHQQVLEFLPEVLPATTYTANSRGIVIVAERGVDSWLAMMSIVQLRQLGSTLPIEIILPKHTDYNPSFCKNILQYHAKCVELRDLVNLPEDTWVLDKPQYRALALLVNSFENVILLDADTFPITNIDKYFDSEVYQDFQMILWPNLMKRSISPLYYDIAQIPIDLETIVRHGSFPLINPVKINTKLSSEEVEFHDLKGTVPVPASSPGQVVVNKRIHYKALMMNLYYNLVGPQIYYHLFDLDRTGTPEKDTLALGALVTESKYYQVKSFPRQFYLGLDQGGSENVAMGQYCPQLDYALYNSQYGMLVTDYPSLDELMPQCDLLDQLYRSFFYKTDSVPLFAIQSTALKFSPVDYMANEEVYDPQSNCLKKRVFPGFVHFIGRNNFDFELELWKLAFRVACLERVWFPVFDKEEFNRMCHFMKHTIDWLKYN